MAAGATAAAWVEAISGAAVGGSTGVADLAAATEVDTVVAIAELTVAAIAELTVAVTTEEDILADSLAEALTVAGTGPGERVLRGLGLGKDAVAPATLRRAGMAFTVAHPHDLPELMPVGERAASRP